MGGTLWQYNGVEFELDMLRGSTADQYQRAFESLEQRGAQVPAEGPLGDIVRAQCRIFLDTFDQLLGEGAGLRITGGVVDDLRLCMDAASSLIEFVNAQAREVGQAQKAFFRKYAPRK